MVYDGIKSTLKTENIFVVYLYNCYIMTELNESASKSVGSLRRHSRLDRTVTSVWQRKRAFDNVHTPPRGGVQLKNKGEDTK